MKKTLRCIVIVAMACLFLQEVHAQEIERVPPGEVMLGKGDMPQGIIFIRNLASRVTYFSLSRYGRKWVNFSLAPGEEGLYRDKRREAKTLIIMITTVGKYPIQRRLNLDFHEIYWNEATKVWDVRPTR